MTLQQQTNPPSLVVSIWWIWGVSLTVSKLRINSFEITIIPHTLKLTNLINLKTGDKVNIEFDMVGKYLNNIYK